MQDNPIRKTIQVLGQTGWVKGDYAEYIFEDSDFEGDNPITVGYCMLGALGKATMDNEHVFQDTEVRWGPTIMPLTGIISDVISEQYPTLYNDALKSDATVIPFFNDHADTTIEDVITVLEKAALRLDEEI